MNTDTSLLLVVAINTAIMAVSILVLALAIRRNETILLSRTNNVLDGVTTKRLDGTVGSLASEDETRRIQGITRAERTVREQTYLDDSPMPEAPQGPNA